MTFQTQVLSFCREQRLLGPGDRVICAVSGGADSVALLWCLYLVREQMGLHLSAAHLNHGLRGAESDRDEDFVRQFCAGYQIPLAVGRTQVQAEGRGLEDAARRARYAFLESLDPEAKIATAHTADDNAETVLLHLIRGAGLRGLGGIAPARGRVIRPMLGTTRQEVEVFLKLWSLPHVEDSSNHQPDFLRNRVRSQVMPLLRRENPRFVQNCSETALALRLDESVLAQEAEQALAELWDGEGLDCPGLLALHPGVRRRVLGGFLRKCGLTEPEAVHLRQVEDLARSRRPSAWVAFPGGLRLGRQYDRLLPLFPVDTLAETQLAVPGVTTVAGWEVQCTYLPAGKKVEDSAFTFVVACDTIATIPSPLVLRARRAGDTLRLPGGRRSLRRLMMDRKIPARLRDALPVIAAGDQILGVGGIGVNPEFAAPVHGPALEIRLIKST